MLRAVELAAGIMLTTFILAANAYAAGGEPDGTRAGTARAQGLRFVAVLESPKENVAPVAVIRLAAALREAGRAVPDPFATAQGSKLAYALSREVRLALGYDFVTGEDLAFEVAETGSLNDDYTSHRLMVRAHLQF